MLGISLYCRHEVGDEVGAALILVLHLAPLALHGLIGVDHTVVLRAACAAENHKDYSDYYECYCTFFHYSVCVK